MSQGMNIRSRAYAAMFSKSNLPITSKVYDDVLGFYIVWLYEFKLSG
jgi:hypothetical protein